MSVRCTPTDTVEVVLRADVIFRSVVGHGECSRHRHVADENVCNAVAAFGTGQVAEVAGIPFVDVIFDDQVTTCDYECNDGKIEICCIIDSLLVAVESL